MPIRNSIYLILAFEETASENQQIGPNSREEKDIASSVLKFLLSSFNNQHIEAVKCASFCYE